MKSPVDLSRAHALISEQNIYNKKKSFFSRTSLIYGLNQRCRREPRPSTYQNIP